MSDRANQGHGNSMSGCRRRANTKKRQKLNAERVSTVSRCHNQDLWAKINPYSNKGRPLKDGRKDWSECARGNQFPALIDLAAPTK
jgi:hypothetical protein